MERGGWILYWLLGLAGLGFLLAAFHVVPPFIFMLDQWAMNACLGIGYFGLVIGNLSLRPADFKQERMFTRKRVLLSAGCGIVVFLFTLALWPFLEFPNPSVGVYAAITAGGFSFLGFFVGALGFPVPAPVVLWLASKLYKRGAHQPDQ